MECRQCGAPLPNGASVCSRCGEEQAGPWERRLLKIGKIWTRCGWALLLLGCAGLLVTLAADLMTANPIDWQDSGPFFLLFGFLTLLGVLCYIPGIWFQAYSERLAHARRMAELLEHRPEKLR